MAWVASFRPHKNLMKIAYKVLRTPKSLQQNTENKPSAKMIKEWYKDSQAGS